MSAPARPHAWNVESSLDRSVGAATLIVRGRLGRAGAGEFRDALTRAIDSDTRVQLDLSGVDYISSAGIGVLQDAAARAHEAGGQLTLTAASESVRLALRLAGSIPRLELSER